MEKRMENEMETVVYGTIGAILLGLYRVYLGDNGKENGSYYRV